MEVLQIDSCEGGFLAFNARQGIFSRIFGADTDEGSNADPENISVAIFSNAYREPD